MIEIKKTVPNISEIEMKKTKQWKDNHTAQVDFLNKFLEKYAAPKNKEN